MDAFNDERLVGFELYLAAAVLAHSGYEVVGGDFDAFAFQHSHQVFVEEFEVDGLNGLEVVIALFVSRDMFAIDEVVVEGYGHGPDAVDPQLDVEPLGESGLAGRGRSGDEDDPYLVGALADVVGDLGELFLVKGFGDADDLGGLPPGDEFVEVGDVWAAEDFPPLFGLLEDLEEFGLFGIRRQNVRVVLFREAKDEAGRVEFEFEYLEVPGARRHRAVEIAEGVAAVVDADGVALQLAEQLDLRVLTGGFGQGDGFGARHYAADERPVGGDYLPHALLKAVNVFGG